MEGQQFAALFCEQIMSTAIKTLHRIVFLGFFIALLLGFHTGTYLKEREFSKAMEAMKEFAESAGAREILLYHCINGTHFYHNGELLHVACIKVDTK